MKRLALIVMGVLLLASECVYAQKNKSENDYNLRKAYEVLSEEKDETKALELVNKQLRETPDNVDALILRIRLLRWKKEFGPALQDVNPALKVNKPKKSEIAQSTLHWWKAHIYSDMEDWQSAAASFKTAYELAQKDDKDNLQSISFDYAQALYYLDDYDGADVIYRKMLALDEADQAAMIGLSRNMIKREQYNEALELLDKCQKYDADYSEIYRFKMSAYDNLGEPNKAIDAGLDWFDKNDDANTDAILKVLKKRPNYAEASIKSRAKKSDNPFQWKALLCQFYESSHMYAEAIKLYDDMENEFGYYDQINIYRSDCYSELGLNELAIADRQLTRSYFADCADFNETEHSFVVHPTIDKGIISWQRQFPGKYQMISRNQHRTMRLPDGVKPYRIGDPLAQFMLTGLTNMGVPVSEVVLDYTNTPINVTLIKQLVGQSGWLTVEQLTIESFEKEDILLHACVTDEGETIPPDIAEYPTTGKQYLSKACRHLRQPLSPPTQSNCSYRCNHDRTQPMSLHHQKTTHHYRKTVECC